MTKNFLQGFSKDFRGYQFNYHSPLSDITSSLLLRADRTFCPIEWQTETVPENLTGDFVHFIWMYAIDTDCKVFSFDLFADDEKIITFTNPPNNEKTKHVYKGIKGSELIFRATMIDKYQDQMGFATLKMPAESVKKGKPLHLKIAAESGGSNVWYILFKETIEEKVKIVQEDAVFKENGKYYFTAGLECIFLGDESILSVNTGADKFEFPIKPGKNSFTLKFPVTKSEKTYHIKTKAGDGAETAADLVMHPVKERTLYMVQHTHTDIGYTRTQDEILAEHLKYIDQALDLCDITDSYPEESMFRWTCETFWAVREYLRCRPEEMTEKLMQRIEEGRIEVTGMFLNYSETADEACLAYQTSALGEIVEKGITVTAAMQNDVNGIGWCMPDYFYGTGVRYLIMGQHGHRARIPFDKPTVFIWESPSGKSLIAYRGEHYMFGNTLGVLSGDTDVFRKNITDYFRSLDKRDYPFRSASVQFSGYVTDNSPPSVTACDFVKEWNEKYKSPKIRLATASEFLSEIEKNHFNELPVIRKAWPDWWTDGAGSAMNETAYVRKACSELTAVTGLLSSAASSGVFIPDNIKNEVSGIYESLLFYHEHTYGAAESVSEPLSAGSVVQWNQKAAYAWDSVKRIGLLKEKAMGLLRPCIEKCGTPTITVYNSLNWKRSGLVTVFIESGILPAGSGFSIIAPDGSLIPVQFSKSGGGGSYWDIWAKDVPGNGSVTYRIIKGGSSSCAPVWSTGENVLENGFYKIVINERTGNVSSLIDKELGSGLIEADTKKSMGRFIYEILSNRQQLERFRYNMQDKNYVPLKGSRHYLTNIEITGCEKGNIWNSIFVKGNIKQCADSNGVVKEIRLYNHAKIIEVRYRMVKKSVTGPESVYILFPFNLKDGKIYYEAQGGTVSPGEDQIEGTAADWNTVQNFIAVQNKKCQIIVGSREAPLVQFGDINTGRFYYTHVPEKTHIYSWVLNNYWTTNFKASQEGELKWNYYMTSSKNTSLSSAARFGRENSVPLIATVIPVKIKGPKTGTAPFCDLDIDNVILIDARPSDKNGGIILYIKETGGRRIEIDIKRLIRTDIKMKVFETDIFGRNKIELKKSLILQPYEVKFIIICTEE